MDLPDGRSVPRRVFAQPGGGGGVRYVNARDIIVVCRRSLLWHACVGLCSGLLEGCRLLPTVFTRLCCCMLNVIHGLGQPLRQALPLSGRKQSCHGRLRLCSGYWMAMCLRDPVSLFCKAGSERQCVWRDEL